MKLNLFGYTFTLVVEEQLYSPSFKETLVYLKKNKISCAGRLEIANRLVSEGKIKKPEQYFELLNAVGEE